jgi:uncharacterized protein
LPMHTSIEKLPNVPNYVALLHGPILLSAKTGTQDLKGLIANSSRWGHIASGERFPVDKAPIIIENDLSKIAGKLQPIANEPLKFSVSNLKLINGKDLVLEPFFQVHDARYMMYWMALSESKFESYLDSLSGLEKEKLALEKRTIDFVALGEQQPEADHFIQSENSQTGNNSDEFWRDARNEGFFSYKMATNAEKNITLMVRYWGAEWGSRKFDIFIDDEKLLTEDNTGRWNQSSFFDLKYAIPNEMVEGKEHIRVKFKAIKGNTAGAVYYIRLLQEKAP